MGLEDIIRAIVPLSFLAIWALTSIFNRDAKPLPPRPGLGGAPTGPTLPPRPVVQTFEVGREPTMRFGSSSQMSDPNVRRAPASSREEDILIIRSEPARTAPRPNQPQPQPQRRPRPKPTGVKKPDSPQPELLGGAVGSNVSQHIRPIDLARTDAPLNAIGNLSKLSTAATVQYDVRSQGLTDIRLSLMNPVRLREAFVMNEILQPPVSRRRPLKLGRAPENR